VQRVIYPEFVGCVIFFKGEAMKEDKRAGRGKPQTKWDASKMSLIQRIYSFFKQVSKSVHIDKGEK
jgi:hypothetical protein